jgi:hypothetical protein
MRIFAGREVTSGPSGGSGVSESLNECLNSVSTKCGNRGREEQARELNQSDEQRYNFAFRRATRFIT